MQSMSASICQVTNVLTQLQVDIIVGGTQAVLHGVSQGFINGVFSGDFGSSFVSAAVSSLVSSGVQLGGGAAGIGNSGAATGFFVSALNHAAHKFEENDIEGDLKFFKRLKDHYESKTQEDVNLTKDEFLFLVKKGKIEYKNAKLINAKNNIYEASINFYDSGFDLANSFGNQL